MADMANDIAALSLQNTQIGNRGPQLKHSRMAKIEFAKFSGDDVKGWVFRCEQFFLFEQTSEMDKARFGNVYDKPMSELNILEYETTVREYEDAFDSLLVPSCYVIFDRKPLSLSFDFVFNPEIFKSLSLFVFIVFAILRSWCQHAHTLHHLESLLTISLDNLFLDNLDIFKEDLEYQSCGSLCL
ncbi:hypothetical protein Tco_0905587 [Tanacetum coccineum]